MAILQEDPAGKNFNNLFPIFKISSISLAVRMPSQKKGSIRGVRLNPSEYSKFPCPFYGRTSLALDSTLGGGVEGSLERSEILGADLLGEKYPELMQC